MSETPKLQISESPKSYRPITSPNHTDHRQFTARTVTVTEHQSRMSEWSAFNLNPCNSSGRSLSTVYSQRKSQLHSEHQSKLHNHHNSNASALDTALSHTATQQSQDAQGAEGAQEQGGTPPAAEQEPNSQASAEQAVAHRSSSHAAAHEVVDLASCASDSENDSHAVRRGAHAAAAGPGPIRHGRQRKDDFRLAAKQFALTYPRCAVERARVDEELKTRFHPSELASAREEHKDGGHHLHVFIAFLKRHDVRSSRHFDVAFDGQTYHPNVQRVRSRAAWLEYISKGADHGVAQLARGFDPLREKLGKRKSMWQDHCWSEQHRVLMALTPVNYPIKLECEGRTYEMLAPDPRHKKRNWWIVAPPNAGKTRWLNKTFAGQCIYSPRTGKYPFEGYLDQDIIVYDDRDGVSFAEFASVLNTWDIVQPVAGEVRYNVQNWKLGHTRSIIVLSNKTIEQSMPEDDWQRMKKRFMQIVNPKLLEDHELSSSDDDEAEPGNAAAAAQYADFMS